MGSEKSFCTQAVAYLKTEFFGESPRISIAFEQQPVLRRLGSGLLAAYLVDNGGSFQYVQNYHLSKAGLTEAQLHRLAVANLLALAKKHLNITSYGEVFVVLLEQNFEASLLLADTLWDEELVHLAPNGFLAAAPARDVLAFCDAASERGIAALRTVIARADSIAVDHPLASVLLRRQERRWVRYPD